MRVLLRQTHTGEYLGTVQTWVMDPSQAYDFQRADEAIRFAQDFKLTNIEVVLRYDRPPSETALRVPPPPA